jgi:PPM family protein phosphatase
MVIKMPILECPGCQTEILPNDHFCEVCGHLLMSSSARISGNSLQTCPKCSALDSADDDGYCSRCGFFLKSIANRIEIMLSSRLAGVSDRGLIHTHNEDALALQGSEQRQVLVVCDGVSSSYQPQLAAQLAAQTICQRLVELTEVVPTQALQTAIADAQITVSAISYPKNVDPPSTTAIAALVEANIATIGWLGDSRAYWVPAPAQPNPAQQLSHDHAWNQQSNLDQPASTEAQLDYSHVITRWIGADADHTSPSIVTFEITTPGHLILCSDGFWNYLFDSRDISKLISPQATAAQIAHQLVNYACSQGGHDNITVAVLNFGS